MPDQVQMTKPGGFRQQPDLRAADAGRALLGRRVGRLGGRLHLRRRCSCRRLLRSRQGACAGDVEPDNVANVNVDVDVDIDNAAYSGKAFMQVMLMLRLMLMCFADSNVDDDVDFDVTVFPGQDMVLV